MDGPIHLGPELFRATGTVRAHWAVDHSVTGASSSTAYVNSINFKSKWLWIRATFSSAVGHKEKQVSWFPLHRKRCCPHLCPQVALCKLPRVTQWWPRVNAINIRTFAIIECDHGRKGGTGGLDFHLTPCSVASHWLLDTHDRHKTCNFRQLTQKEAMEKVSTSFPFSSPSSGRCQWRPTGCLTLSLQITFSFFIQTFE
jgi:hypothetical protein